MQVNSTPVQKIAPAMARRQSVSMVSSPVSAEAVFVGLN
jgi:hypothetical protein